MVESHAATLVRDEREIARLVTKARAQGQPDAFLGKRRWTRYRLGLRLEITTGGTAPDDTWNITMHNVSGGGFGFWSKRPVDLGTAIYVREWTEANRGEWIPARVTHCTVGIQGHLIGARFDHPCTSDETAVQSDTGDESNDEESHVMPGSTGPGTSGSLRCKCAFVAAATAGLSGVAFAVAVRFRPDSVAIVPWLAGTALASCALSALLGWWIVRGEARFLAAFYRAIRRMAERGAMPDLPARAPSREMAALRHAFHDLGSRWRRREDDERAQRQKLEELTQIKSNILSIVSHDLRTPLTSILLYAQMLTEEIEALAKEDQQRFLRIITDECNRLSRLVDDLLEVQRLESGRVRWDLRPRDLSDTVRSCARVFDAMARARSIDFRVECPDSLPTVEADADKVSQVLSNLLSNAMKYAPSGGRVSLSAEPHGHQILLRVADTGPGIPREKWDQVFDRFTQLGDPNVSEIEGAGLGLYIVKRIVECHGGVAWVDSETGKGSEFFVAFPTQGTYNAHGHADDPLVSAAGRVVVCDSDPQLAAVIAQTLRWKNYDVRTAHCGARLFGQLAQGDVDVVITDVLLPDMNAAEVLDALNEDEGRSFRLIVHSYAGDESDVALPGVDVFLRRPVSREELLRAVEHVMRKRSAVSRTLLFVDDGIDVERFRSLLVSETVLVVPHLSAARQRIEEYLADLVVVKDHALGDGWERLAELGDRIGRHTRVIVLCDAVRKRERRLAEQHAVTVLPYRRGYEEELVRAMVQSDASRLMEVTK